MMSRLSKRVKKAEGCFVRDKGVTITCGRNLYEAVVALTILEKSAEVNLKMQKRWAAQTTAENRSWIS